MARTTSAQTLIAANTTITAGGSDVTSTGWTAIGYGVSGCAKVYAASLPTGGLNFVIECAQDSSGTGAMEVRRQQMLPVATGSGNAVFCPFALAPGGLDGDWSHYRVTITAPVAQNATIQVEAMSTTAF